MTIKDNYVTVNYNPTRDKSVIDIPYADYIIRITLANEATYDVFNDNIQVLQRKIPESTQLEIVTGDLIVKFDYTTNIRPTGDNLLKIMALLSNLVDQQ